MSEGRGRNRSNQLFFFPLWGGFLANLLDCQSNVWPQIPQQRYLLREKYNQYSMFGWIIKAKT